MNERVAYYERRKHAKNNPDTIMSVITDGFAQTHCLLPWVANQMNYPLQLEQVILNTLQKNYILYILYKFRKCWEFLNTGADLLSIDALKT